MSGAKQETIKTIHEENVDLKARRIYVFTEIDSDISKVTVQNLHFLDQTDGDIHIYFCTPGGSWDYGLAIYFAVLHCKNQVIGHVMGDCSSMGSVILQACDTRKIYDNSTMLIHPGHTSASTAVLDFIERADWEKKVLKIMNRIYYERMKKTKSEEDLPSYRKFVSFISRDRFLLADRALKLGLVDEIEKIEEE